MGLTDGWGLDGMGRWDVVDEKGNVLGGLG